MTETVGKAATKTALAASPAASIFGQSLTFTATVTVIGLGGGKPTGTVSFFDGSSKLGTVRLSAAGTAVYSTSALTVGGNTITAAYSGDTNFADGSASQTETVRQARTTTTLTNPSKSAKVGQSLTFTAVVKAAVPGSGTPTATVSFWDGCTLLGTATPDANGKAVFKTASLSVGSHTITVSYAGDTNFSSSSTSSGLTVTIKASTGAASSAVQDASASSSASGINDAAIASLLAEWDSQASLDLADSLSSV